MASVMELNTASTIEPISEAGFACLENPDRSADIVRDHQAKNHTGSHYRKKYQKVRTPNGGALEVSSLQLV